MLGGKSMIGDIPQYGHKMGNIIKIKSKKEDREVYDAVIAVAVKYNADNNTDRIVLLEPDGMLESKTLYYLDIARQLILNKVSEMGRIAIEGDIIDIQQAMIDKLGIKKTDDTN